MNIVNPLNLSNLCLNNLNFDLIAKNMVFQFTIALSFFIIKKELNLRNRRMEDEYPRVSR
ncbi:hypothethical protein [Staphylococcus caprae]|uniref:Hypothethical protein n=1 Tax=Staphylococcus caprae TaxID=29380 RepID=A0ABN5W468_9STAP|nr:hypothethical protein [Staphylococcus caprae]BBD92706.1 hypothethical protein [Staphylococcus caprae]BBD95211.1 hypothetical protein JMUB898_1642 [Staphylococcus caprae]